MRVHFQVLVVRGVDLRFDVFFQVGHLVRKSVLATLFQKKKKNFPPDYAWEG